MVYFSIRHIKLGIDVIPRKGFSLRRAGKKMPGIRKVWQPIGTGTFAYQRSEGADGRAACIPEAAVSQRIVPKKPIPAGDLHPQFPQLAALIRKQLVPDVRVLSEAIAFKEIEENAERLSAISEAAGHRPAAVARFIFRVGLEVVENSISGGLLK